MYLEARLCTRSKRAMRSMICGDQTCVAYPICDRTSVIYSVRRALQFLIVPVDLLMKPNILFAFEHCSNTCLRQVKLFDIHTPRSRSFSTFSNMLSCKVYLQVCRFYLNRQICNADFDHLGPVVQRWISANPGLKFNPLF